MTPIERGARAMKEAIFRYTVDKARNSDSYVLIEDLSGQVVFTGSYPKCDQRRNEIAFAAGLAAMWQDISTAPRDGTEILGLSDDGIRQVIRWSKHNHVPIYGWVRQIELYGEEVDGFDPISWFPLSTPPAATEAA